MGLFLCEFRESDVQMTFLREVDIIPDYLVAGLLPSENSDKDHDRTAEQELSSIWQQVTVDGIPVIVRSANRRNTRVRRADSRRPRGI